MKKLVATLLVLMSVSVSAHAADAIKIAVVDEVSVFNEADESKKFSEQLKKEYAENEAKLREMEKEFTQKKEELARKKGVLSDEKFLDEETELRKMGSRFRNEQRSMVEAFERKQAAKRRDVYEAITSAIAEVSKAKGYDIVLPKGAVLYNIDGIDISAAVLEKVNKKLASKN